jgi:hypothetical protein
LGLGTGSTGKNSPVLLHHRVHQVIGVKVDIGEKVSISLHTRRRARHQCAWCPFQGAADARQSSESEEAAILGKVRPRGTTVWTFKEVAWPRNDLMQICHRRRQPIFSFVLKQRGVGLANGITGDVNESQKLHAKVRGGVSRFKESAALG